MLGTAEVYTPMSPRRRVQAPRGFVWTGDLDALAAALGVPTSYLERCRDGEEKASAPLARLVEQLTGGEVRLDVKRPGRPPKKLEHPVARWIDQHRGGDKAKFAGEIGITVQHLRAVLSGREELTPRLARKMAEVMGVSWKELYED
jgi:DNA-binding transcriptional regulator YdaS (Cro superfamily)